MSVEEYNKANTLCVSFVTLYGGQFMLSPQVIIPNYQNTEAYQLEVVIYILHLFLVIELICKEVCSS